MIFFILKFLQHDKDFLGRARKHSELSFHALFTKSDIRKLRNCTSKNINLSVLCLLEFCQVYSTPKLEAARTAQPVPSYCLRCRLQSMKIAQQQRSAGEAESYASNKFEFCSLSLKRLESAKLSAFAKMTMRAQILGVIWRAIGMHEIPSSMFGTTWEENSTSASLKHWDSQSGISLKLGEGSQPFLSTLVDSMTRRVGAVISASGGPTRYQLYS